MTDKTGENKAAAIAAAVARKNWKEAQRTAAPVPVPSGGWIDINDRQPDDEQVVLIATGPFWQYPMPVLMARFFLVSRHKKLLQHYFPDEFDNEEEEYRFAFTDPTGPYTGSLLLD